MWLSGTKKKKKDFLLNFSSSNVPITSLCFCNESNAQKHVNIHCYNGSRHFQPHSCNTRRTKKLRNQTSDCWDQVILHQLWFLFLSFQKLSVAKYYWCRKPKVVEVQSTICSSSDSVTQVAIATEQKLRTRSWPSRFLLCFLLDQVGMETTPDALGSISK